MSTTVVVLAGLSAGTYALKAAGPLLLGGRPLPAALASIARHLPAALLAALVVVSTLGDGRALAVDARLVGVVVAGLALARRLPFVVVVLAAIAATATTRMIG